MNSYIFIVSIIYILLKTNIYLLVCLNLVLPKCILYYLQTVTFNISHLCLLSLFCCVIAGCEDCGKSHAGICKKHGAVHKVQDAVIPSRARLTVPPSLSLKTIKENGTVCESYFTILCSKIQLTVTNN